jgi:hypothetical protein
LQCGKKTALKDTLKAPGPGIDTQFPSDDTADIISTIENLGGKWVLKFTAKEMCDIAPSSGGLVANPSGGLTPR